MKKIIILYDYTGIMAQPWLKNGFEVWCFDGQHEDGIIRDGNHVKVGMWFDPYQTSHHVADIVNMVGEGVCLVFGFPECTHLAVSGSGRFAQKLAANPAVQAEATELARLVMYLGDAFGVPWALENPVGVLGTIWGRKADFIFHPYQYGGYLPEDDVHPLYPDFIPPRDAYTKKTCIYSGNGFSTPLKRPVHSRLINSVLGPDDDVDKRSDLSVRYSPQYRRLGGTSTRTKQIRSATPRGFSIAVYRANVWHCTTNQYGKT